MWNGTFRICLQFNKGNLKLSANFRKWKNRLQHLWNHNREKQWNSSEPYMVIIQCTNNKQVKNSNKITVVVEFLRRLIFVVSLKEKHAARIGTIIFLCTTFYSVPWKPNKICPSRCKKTKIVITSGLKQTSTCLLFTLLTSHQTINSPQNIKQSWHKFTQQNINKCQPEKNNF